MPDPIFLNTLRVGAALAQHVELTADPISPEDSLSTAVRKVLADVPEALVGDEVAAYLDSWPSALQRAMVGAMWDAANKGVALTMTWMPASDFHLEIAQPTKGGLTFVSAVLRSPYPSDLAASQG